MPEIPESLEHATCRIRTDEEEIAVRNAELLRKMGYREIVLDVLDNLEEGHIGSLVKRDHS